ncbi:P-type ATPase-like protein [Kalaharituber pfeilii]|nr:P-type ATPase-like protein [Kalaharituber pfeilii]
MADPVRSPPSTGRVQRSSMEVRRPAARRDSNVSSASFYSDVEMAQHEVFSGPMSESLPSSVSTFAHRRRSRADSTASFTFFQDMNNEQLGWPGQDHESVLADGSDDEYEYAPSEADLETGGFEGTSIRRKSSQLRRDSVEDPLLERRDSIKSDSGYRGTKRSTQKIYIMTEDLTIVAAGFTTSRVGSIILIVLSIATFGAVYLLTRWIPKWRIRLVGKPAPLQSCDWIVIENQWNELSVHHVEKRRYGLPLSSVFGESETPLPMDIDEDDDPVLPYLRYIDYRYIRFCYHPLLDKFLLNNSWKDPSWINMKKLRQGIEGGDKDYRSLVFGKNVIDIEEKSVTQLLIDEAFHPFYVFQIASLILWSIDEYYYYAICIFIISAVSIISTLIETKTTMRRLREVSRFVCDVRVLRSGFWSYISSEDLVPGDVFEITDPSLSQFPCDSILLSGDCIVNESMLTGESIPISKAPCTNEALERINLAASTVLPDLAKHFLFAGTKIVRARKPQEGSDTGAVGLAMVVRTGFNTTKGALVRSMLFPKPSGFKFYRDSFYYIGVMAVIACCGFVASFINFVRLGLAWHVIIVRALDLITIVVPPALPATLTIGTNFALSRLKKKNIFCISPQRVNVGGKLDIVCFDKTGTLTEDGLDVLGVRVVGSNPKRFGELQSDPRSMLLPAGHEEADLRQAVFNTMTTCHSLRIVDDGLVGDPLDQKMFEFTGWIYSEGDHSTGQSENNTRSQEQVQQSKFSPPIVRPPPGWPVLTEIRANNADVSQPKLIELGITKSFEFVSQLRRTSVIVKQFKAQGADIYVKGAPECMPDICVPESFPEDYDELLAYYTHRGYRVIGCATKHIPKLSWVKAQKMKRTEAESGLTFAGFIIFENKLKPQTAGALSELQQADIRQVMCTGDNILTAISVARECGLISKMSHVFVPHFIEGDMLSPNARLQWENVNNPSYTLDENTLLPLDPPTDGNPYEMIGVQDYSLAVSGDVFRWAIDFAPLETLHKMLIRGQVFARMSPDEKHELVEKLQSIDYCVGFCGDGANDCGALKAADVGISLSEAEASVAAPFTSRVFDISCVPRIIREGRASLVTSFSCFKYMSLYSAIQFTTVSILYRNASNLGDFQFLFIDLFLILPIAVFMGWSGAFPVLCAKRPTASLVSRKVLTPLLGQIILAFLLQFVILRAVQKQRWYIPPVVNHDKPSIENSENTSLFLVSCYQYIFAAVILTVGPPYRKPMMSNIPFVITITTTLLLSTYLLIGPVKWLYEMMQLTELRTSFRFVILATAMAGAGISYVAEKKVLPEVANAIGAMRSWIRGKPKARKKYKLLEKETRV